MPYCLYDSPSLTRSGGILRTFGSFLVVHCKSLGRTSYRHLVRETFLTATLKLLIHGTVSFYEYHECSITYSSDNHKAFSGEIERCGFTRNSNWFIHLSMLIDSFLVNLSLHAFIICIKSCILAVLMDSDGSWYYSGYH
eukprot:NODE_183_length_15731_cov_0.226778.p7 type:complete len:139 gc:universal NODE_183_length_15731_cov_0.226778:13186-13602(+)